MRGKQAGVGEAGGPISGAVSARGSGPGWLIALIRQGGTPGIELARVVPDRVGILVRRGGVDEVRRGPFS